MIETFSLPIEALTGDAPRKIYVYLPEAAEADPEARFPVLYMFDGHNIFFDEEATYGKSWGIGDWLDETGTGLMVVGVDCDHTPPTGRLNEYSPFDFSSRWFGQVEGRGGLFMDWLCDTLKPLIDERYPTLPERETTWIAGSSMGGLMSLFAISAYNQVFGKCAALSPSIALTKSQIIPLIKETDFAPGTVVYMDMGQQEHEGGRRGLRALERTISALMDKGVLVNYRTVPGGAHCEATWQRQIPFFMETLFYEPGLEFLEPEEDEAPEEAELDPEEVMEEETESEE